MSPLIYELHWLPIKYRIEFKILLITFKILNFLAPTYLSSLVSLRLPSKYNLRNSSDNLLLSYPRFKSKATLGDRSFTCAAPKLWNALPFDIRSASTVSIFKAKLKTHLFRHSLLFIVIIVVFITFTFNCNFSFLAFLFRFLILSCAFEHFMEFVHYKFIIIIIIIKRASKTRFKTKLHSFLVDILMKHDD